MNLKFRIDRLERRFPVEKKRGQFWNLSALTLCELLRLEAFALRVHATTHHDPESVLTAAELDEFRRISAKALAPLLSTHVPDGTEEVIHDVPAEDINDSRACSHRDCRAARHGDAWSFDRGGAPCLPD